MLRPTCCFHPLSTVFVDDEPDFLDALQLSLPDDMVNTIMCVNPRDALNLIEQSGQYPYNPILNEVAHHQDHLDIDELNTESINLRVDHIKNRIYDMNRFDTIGTMVTDYNMPDMTGVELCRQIKNHQIAKIMLTAETDLNIAVDAFNEGVVDKFLLKHADDLVTALSNQLLHYQESYFQNLSAPILAVLNAPTLNQLLSSSEFIKIFNQVFQQSEAVEYYLLDTSGSYLFLDQAGRPTWLFVRSNQDYHEHLAILAGLEGTAHLSRALSKREKILSILREADWQQPVANWDKFLFPATQLNHTTWYSVVKSNITSNITWSSVKPYQES